MVQRKAAGQSSIEQCGTAIIGDQKVDYLSIGKVDEPAECGS